MIKPTCDEVHKALKDSIELRWKLLLKGADYYDVPNCQLCEIFRDRKSDEDDPCAGCPISLIGEQCVNCDGASNPRAAYNKWWFNKTAKNAQNMINKLQLCLDKYFPEWCDK